MSNARDLRKRNFVSTFYEGHYIGGFLEGVRVSIGAGASCVSRSTLIKEGCKPEDSYDNRSNQVVRRDDMATQDNLGIRMAADVAATGTPARTRWGIRCVLRFSAPILLASACFLLGATARAQSGGYMRALTTHGQVAGESTDPRFNGWILLHGAVLPSAPQIAAMADESSAGGTSSDKAVHKPVAIVKEMDRSSLALLAAFTSRQHFPEIDIVTTSPGGEPTARYKLTDATIISVRAGDTGGGTHEAFEQVRIGYAKIEIQQ